MKYRHEIEIKQGFPLGTTANWHHMAQRGREGDKKKNDFQ